MAVSSEIDATTARLSERIDRLDALATFLHADIEQHKSALARELHDDLGGSVIAAMMDVSWIEKHESELSSDTIMRLDRIKEGLRHAIDLARKMVEELRPTLLDTIGLFAALSWQFRRGCKRAGLKYTETYPDLNPQLSAKVLIALFRIAQEAFDLILQHEELSMLDLRVQTADATFSLQLTDNGKAAQGESSGGIASSIAHRIRPFGGRLDFARREHGSTLRVSLPLNSVNCPPAADGPAF